MWDQSRLYTTLFENIEFIKVFLTFPVRKKLLAAKVFLVFQRIHENSHLALDQVRQKLFHCDFFSTM